MPCHSHFTYPGTVSTLVPSSTPLCSSRSPFPDTTGNHRHSVDHLLEPEAVGDHLPLALLRGQHEVLLEGAGGVLQPHLA